MVLGSLLGPQRPSSEKLSPYECGFEAFEDARMQFDIRYYLIAILFIVFFAVEAEKWLVRRGRLYGEPADVASGR